MAPYAYFCTLCHHLATSHHLTPGAETVTAGPYRCSHTDCQCEISQTTPLSGVGRLAYLLDYTAERAQ